MQSVSARIWTRNAVSISYDDKHYTKGTSFPEGISPEVDAIEGLELKLAFYNVPVKHLCHNGTEMLIEAFCSIGYRYPNIFLYILETYGIRKNFLIKIVHISIK